MRDYGELVKALRCCADGICRDCPRLQTPEGDFECKYKLRIDAADAIEELLDELTTICKQFPRWISVEERLPEESGYTIIFCADGDRGHVTFGKFLKTPKLWELSGARSYWRVLKWMPLPEPPKGVE